ncbi:MAG: sugar nucleotide-binding protein [Moraxella sp.]|nr:sugar nucleotide-binding protein [Moraxella sp.]
MVILLFGATGFIGRQLAVQLQALGHEVRTPKRAEVDFAHLDTLDAISTLMCGVDVVVNTCGVLSTDAALMEQVHHHSPAMLGLLAKRAGVKRWINLSALGADPLNPIAFVGSKGRGDTALLELADASFLVCVVRPSLIFGQHGASTRLFLALAKLPLLCLPHRGKYLIQPVCQEDVIEGLIRLSLGGSVPTLIHFTGQQVGTLASYLMTLRYHIHQQSACPILSLPLPLARFGMRLLGMMGVRITTDMLDLLAQGNCADTDAFAQLLGRAPLGFTHFHY